MRIATTIATPMGFGESTSNRMRIRDACLGIDAAAEAGARLLVLPAGLLCVVNGKQERAGAEIVARARERCIAVVFGVDTRGGSRSKRANNQKLVNREWPFFVIAQGTADTSSIWRQRCTNRSNGSDIDGEPERRVIEVDGELVGVLACGEVFSPVMRAACKTWGVRRIVVPFHSAAGSRFSHAVAWARRNRMHCVRAVHAKSAELGTRNMKPLRATETLAVWTAQF
jgi:hypothetical protein